MFGDVIDDCTYWADSEPEFDWSPYRGELDTLRSKRNCVRSDDEDEGVEGPSIQPLPNDEQNLDDESIVLASAQSPVGDDLMENEDDAWLANDESD